MKQETVNVGDVLRKLERAALLNCSISPHRHLFQLAAGVIRALVVETYELRQAQTLAEPSGSISEDAESVGDAIAVTPGVADA